MSRDIKNKRFYDPVTMPFVACQILGGRGMLEGNAVPEIGSIVADPWTMEWVSDNNGLPGEMTWTVLVWTDEGWRVHFQSESVIEAGIERQRERQRQMGAKCEARREREKSSNPDEGEKGPPPAPANTPESQDALVREVMDYVSKFLDQRPRRDRAEDESMAKTIQQELEEKNIGRIGITALKKMIADLAPLPRGRKAKVPPTEVAADPQAGNEKHDCELPRFGQKRRIGKCYGAWYPYDLVDPPGPIERHGAEVWKSTNASPSGEWTRLPGEFETREQVDPVYEIV